MLGCFNVLEWMATQWSLRHTKPCEVVTIFYLDNDMGSVRKREKICGDSILGCIFDVLRSKHKRRLALDM